MHHLAIYVLCMLSVACLIFMFLSCGLPFILHDARVSFIDIDTLCDARFICYVACIVFIDSSVPSILALPYDTYFICENVDGSQRLYLTYSSHDMLRALNSCIKCECVILLVKIIYHMRYDYMYNTCKVRDI